MAHNEPASPEMESSVDHFFRLLESEHDSGLLAQAAFSVGMRGNTWEDFARVQVKANSKVIGV